MSLSTKPTQLLVSTFLVSILVTFLGPTMHQPCPYPCYPPPTGTGGSTSGTPPATTLPPPSQSSYPPPSGYNYPTPAGNLPNYPAPPNINNNNNFYGPPPPDPILPYFPFYYRKPPHQTDDQSSAAATTTTSTAIIAATNLVFVFLSFIFLRV